MSFLTDFSRRWTAAVFFAMATFLVAGCGGGRNHAQPAPPSTPPSPATARSTASETEPAVPKKAKVLYTETGYASWYGEPYNGRRGANGEIYDMNAYTAAHRTFPFNSLVRVANLKTGQSVVVRITDRGPFVTDRIIDLSKAAAKKVDVYLHGTQKVRLDVLESPSSLQSGGRWAVQMGAFDDESSAAQMQDRLTRRYRSAKVLKFSGPRDDWWVRVRVQNDDRRKAEEVARDNRVPQGAVYLVRLD